MTTTYFSKAELEALEILGQVGSGQAAVYDSPQYRFANIIYNLAYAQRSQVEYSKAETVSIAEHALRTVIEVAIALYNTTPTEAAIINACGAKGWSYNAAVLLAKAVLDLWFSIGTDLGAQSLSNASTFAATWSVANGFTVSGEKLVYAHNAGANTATQIVGNLTVAGVASKWYKLDYTISDVTVVTGVLALSGFAAASTPLNILAGKNTTYFISAATLPGAGNFVLTGTSASGGYKIDDLQLVRLVPAFLDTTGNLTVMTVEGKQRIADFAIKAVRGLAEGQRAFYGPNPVL